VIDAAGPLLSYRLVVTRPFEIPFEEIGAAFDRELLQPSCALCEVLYALGLMPSQVGGPWPYHPTPPWSTGPLQDVYPRSPKDLQKDFPSDALCRGACGIDCIACEVQGQEVYGCEQIGDRHRWWRYPNWNVCGSHQGCRDHDACYDWAVGLGEGSILGPLHRLCDFECLCQHGLANCLPWAVGAGDKPDAMRFSNQPEPKPGCRGPCPDDEGGPKPSGTKYRIELEDIPLFDAMSKEATLIDEAVDVPVWAGALPPPASLITVTVEAKAGLSARASGTVGPGAITGLVFEADPSTGTYVGQGQIELAGAANLTVRAVGGLELATQVAGVLPLASAPATLVADALAEATGTFKAGGAIAFHCKQGEPDFDTNVDLKLDTCMWLDFKLAAELSLRLLKLFKVAQLRWDLASRRWGDCWQMGSMIKPLSVADDLDERLVSLEIPTMQLVDLLKTLFKDDPKGTYKNVKPECGTQGFPDTFVRGTGSDRGETVEAAPLTRCPGNTRGTKAKVPTTPPGLNDAKTACLTSETLRRVWPPAHLLHGKTPRTGNRTMHGPGHLAWNLIFADNQVNGQMSARVEQPILDRIYDNGEIMWYNVEVTDYGDKTGYHRYFANNIRVSYGCYDIDSPNTRKPDEGSPKDFPRQVDLPSCV
jgi:hypothetical protein